MGRSWPTDEGAWGLRLGTRSVRSTTATPIPHLLSAGSAGAGPGCFGANDIHTQRGVLVRLHRGIRCGTLPRGVDEGLVPVRQCTPIDQFAFSSSPAVKIRINARIPSQWRLCEAVLDETYAFIPRPAQRVKPIIPLDARIARLQLLDFLLDQSQGTLHLVSVLATTNIVARLVLNPFDATAGFFRKNAQFPDLGVGNMHDTVDFILHVAG